MAQDFDTLLNIFENPDLLRELSSADKEQREAIERTVSEHENRVMSTHMENAGISTLGQG